MTFMGFVLFTVSLFLDTTVTDYKRFKYRNNVLYKTPPR